MTKPPSSMEGGFVWIWRWCVSSATRRELPAVAAGAPRSGGRRPVRGTRSPGGSGAEQGPSLLRCVRKDRASERGQAAARPSEEAKPAGRAGEATAEPAATVATPRSGRLRPNGSRSKWSITRTRARCAAQIGTGAMAMDLSAPCPWSMPERRDPLDACLCGRPDCRRRPTSHERHTLVLSPGRVTRSVDSSSQGDVFARLTGSGGDAPPTSEVTLRVTSIRTMGSNQDTSFGPSEPRRSSAYTTPDEFSRSRGAARTSSAPDHGSLTVKAGPDPGHDPRTFSGAEAAAQSGRGSLGSQHQPEQGVPAPPGGPTPVGHARWEPQDHGGVLGEARRRPARRHRDEGQ